MPDFKTTKHYTPLIGTALFTEYETEIYYAWRPNLPDEADNHLIELAIAGGATDIVTRNIKDLAKGELRFPQIRILLPKQCLEILP